MITPNEVELLPNPHPFNDDWTRAIDRLLSTPWEHNEDRRMWRPPKWFVEWDELEMYRDAYAGRGWCCYITFAGLLSRWYLVFCKPDHRLHHSNGASSSCSTIEGVVAE